MAAFVYSWVLSLGTQPKYLFYELSRATHWKWNIPLGELETFTERLVVCILPPPPPTSLHFLSPGSAAACFCQDSVGGGQTSDVGIPYTLVLYCCAFEASPWLLQKNHQALDKLPVLRCFFCGLFPNSTRCPKGRTRTLCTRQLFIVLESYSHTCAKLQPIYWLEWENNKRVATFQTIVTWT